MDLRTGHLAVANPQIQKVFIQQDLCPTCKVNFFLVNMPASSPGQYGDYYCDANCVGGNCCAEFDINAALM
jgi:hypothetical protein